MSALTILMNPEDQLPSGPMIQVVLPEGQREFPFSDLALEGDNPATIADDTLKQRVERWLDLRAGTLDRNYKVARPSTGNIMIQRVGVYGGSQVKIGITCVDDQEAEELLLKALERVRTNHEPFILIEGERHLVVATTGKIQKVLVNQVIETVEKGSSVIGAKFDSL